MGEAAAAAATTDAVHGRLRRRGHRRHRRQTLRHGAGHEGGHRIVHRHAARRRAGLRLVAVNALGDVRDPATGKIVAGARKSAGSREFVDSEAAMLRGTVIGGAPAEHHARRGRHQRETQ